MADDPRIDVDDQEYPAVAITAPVESFQILHGLSGQMREWEHMEALNEVSGGHIGKLTRAVHQSLEPVMMVDEDSPDGFEWSLRADAMRRFFDPFLLFVRDGVRCRSCYRHGRVFLKIMADKLIRAGTLTTRDVITTALSRFEAEPGRPCHLHQTPGGTDE